MPRGQPEVITAVASSCEVPVGAKLSPNADDIVGVSAACLEAGANFLTLTNTILGFGIDPGTARPLLSGGVGGYSGPGLKAISLRCVYEVTRALPGAPVVGCGGVMTGNRRRGIPLGRGIGRSHRHSPSRRATPASGSSVS